MERMSPYPDPHESHGIRRVPSCYGAVNALAAAMNKRNIKPEIEVYHPGGLHTVNDLIANGHLAKPYWI